jgi:hypothetical protein
VNTAMEVGKSAAFCLGKGKAKKSEFQTRKEW